MTAKRTEAFSKSHIPHLRGRSSDSWLQETDHAISCLWRSWDVPIKGAGWGVGGRLPSGLPCFSLTTALSASYHRLAPRAGSWNQTAPRKWLCRHDRKSQELGLVPKSSFWPSHQASSKEIHIFRNLENFNGSAVGLSLNVTSADSRITRNANSFSLPWKVNEGTPVIF